MSAPNWLSSRYNISLSYVSAGKVEYVGVCEPGATKAQARWAIFKLFYTGDDITDLRWADATRAFTKVWDDRATYIYSTV